MCTSKPSLTNHLISHHCWTSVQESFPEYPELLCQAISLGRRLQEPLLEFSSLACAEDDELLSLRMDPLQGLLDTDELQSCLELELVTRINDVGVDVNFCLEHPHGASMLPFVCGLGPRKAMFLLKVCSHFLILFAILQTLYIHMFSVITTAIASLYSTYVTKQLYHIQYIL